MLETRCEDERGWLGDLRARIAGCSFRFGDAATGGEAGELEADSGGTGVPCICCDECGAGRAWIECRAGARDDGGADAYDTKQAPPRLARSFDATGTIGRSSGVARDRVLPV